MVVNSLTAYPYLRGCPIRYSQVNWRPSWYVFLRIQNREIKNTEFHKFFDKQNLARIISWFDMNIIQQIGIASKVTLKVRIRIVCGMVNKLPVEVLTRELKIDGIAGIYLDYHSKGIGSWLTLYSLKSP